MDSVPEASGGDIDAIVDRIFVGTVSRVHFVQDGLAENCDPRLYEWPLQVDFDIQENIKGEGDTASVFINPQKMQWNSIPKHRMDGAWIPQGKRSPAIELSSSVAWSSEYAVQEGQTVLIHAVEEEGKLFTSGMPWGVSYEDGFKFQAHEWCVMSMPQALRGTFTIDTLRQELQRAPQVEARDDVMSFENVSESYCSPDVQPTPMESGPDAGN
ncbi:hypothetical protein FRD01_20505 [Microvenator marinus]|uniref:Uncharacterized protein n=1 Tax=Microvenator marinus TaxID=2600177 RepID=A0A5B8XZR9_9DELT|nr:hypothetical protein [Microvenator marinus]QED29573.1 hypothetical protein FRD01_20505 [Microvenator marinus]